MFIFFDHTTRGHQLHLECFAPVWFSPVPHSPFFATPTPSGSPGQSLMVKTSFHLFYHSVRCPQCWTASLPASVVGFPPKPVPGLTPCVTRRVNKDSSVRHGALGSICTRYSNWEEFEHVITRIIAAHSSSFSHV